MRQIAWLELNDGMWYLITDALAKPDPKGRKWTDMDAAVQELAEEGWQITDSYQNELSAKLGLNQNLQGYGLMRWIH